MKNKKRKILDDYHYRFQIILNNSRFNKRIEELRSLFEKFNCAIPKNGFANWTEVQRWRDKLGTEYSKVVRSEKYQLDKQKIVALNDFTKLEKWEKENTPPVAWMSNAKEILSDFGLDSKDKINQDILRNYILFRRYKDSRIISKLRLTRNKKTNDLELWLRIYPYTQQKDLRWKEIEKAKKILPGYVGKTKGKKYFNRDYEIYRLYRKACEDTNGDEKIAFRLIAGKESKYKYVDRLSKIEKKYKSPELSEENIRKIIAYFHNLIGSVDL